MGSKVTASDVDTAIALRAAINKLARQFNASATHEGLTPSQASALGVIAFNGPMSLAELTAIEGLNPSMVSRIVGKFDDDGLIRREQNPNDLRAGTVEITPAGLEIHNRIKAERAAVVSAALDRMPRDARAALVTALPAMDAFGNALKEVAAEG